MSDETFTAYLTEVERILNKLANNKGCRRFARRKSINSKCFVEGQLGSFAAYGIVHKGRWFPEIVASHAVTGRPILVKMAPRLPSFPSAETKMAESGAQPHGRGRSASYWRTLSAWTMAKGPS